ncbi:MAG: PEP-CTERM sorting domain-containing protein, partial [Cyanobium sp.]
MTRPDFPAVPAAPLALPEVAPAAPLWRRPIVLAGAGLLASDAMAHLLHLEGGSLLGLGALAGGWWLLSRRRRPLPA